MCRVLSYLGEPIIVEDLLYNPDNSFIKQSYSPKQMFHLLNLAGFGLLAWDKTSHNPIAPYIYKTANLPFYDGNLRNLAAKINPYCLLTHIRGVSYNEKQIVSLQNVHPFIFKSTDIALAHNGSLKSFVKMKYDLLDYIKPIFRDNIYGTTDSEWIYAVFLSQLKNPMGFHGVTDILDGLTKTFKILQHVRTKYDIAITSPINLFLSNGEFLAATRYAFDFGWEPFEERASAHLDYHSLWYTAGESYGYYDGEYKMKGGESKKCIIIASEPLTEDTTTWIEIPEYSLMVAWRENGEIKIVTQDIVL